MTENTEIEKVGGGNQEEYFQSDELLKIFKDLTGLRSCGKCPFCKKEASPQTSWTELEKKEFKISGMCAECQRSFFK